MCRQAAASMEASHETFILSTEKKCTFPCHLRLLTKENTERILEDVFFCEYRKEVAAVEFNHVKVEPRRITAVADKIEESVSIMSSALLAVREAIQGKLAPSWQGEPASNFFAKAETDSQTFDSHIKMLRDLTCGLKEASGVYAQSESSALDQVRNLLLREGDEL